MAGRAIRISCVIIITFLLLAGTFASLGATVLASNSINNNYTDFWQEGETNYTALGLRFIQQQYPNKSVTLISSWERIDRDVGFNYTIVDADIFPGSVLGLSDTKEISIRHDTKNIEFGLAQINCDAEIYYNTLPAPYRKMSCDLRIYLKEKLSGLPSVNKMKQQDNRIDVTFSTTHDNISLLIERITSDGGFIISSPTPSTNQYLWDIYANITISGLIKIASLPFVNEVSPDFHPSSLSFIDKSVPYIGVPQVHNGAIGGTPYSGWGTVVGIIDTGIGDPYPNPSRGSIPLSIKYNFDNIYGPRGVAESMNFQVPPGYPENCEDSTGHGTMVAGIIGSNGIGENGNNIVQTNYLGVAPNSTLAIAKVQTGLDLTYPYTYRALHINPSVSPTICAAL